MNQAEFRERKPEGHEHEWEPVGFRSYQYQPDLERAKVDFICRGCNGWTYGTFHWVGFYLGGDDEWGEQ